MSAMKKREHRPIATLLGLLALIISLFQPIPAQAVDFAGYHRPMPMALEPGQSATLLPDGRWLLIGGQSENGPSALALIMDMNKDKTTTLRSQLQYPRAWHTATLLPDGRILVFGGLDANGSVVAETEILDPQAEQFETLGDPGLTPRARHTATLLTGGQILIAGGVSGNGMPLIESELFDPRTGMAEPFFHAALQTGRSDHHAALLPTEPVIVWGGRDSAGADVSDGELYDPQAQRFTPIDAATEASLPPAPLAEATPQIEATHPEDGARHMVLDTIIAVRFSKHLDVTTLNSDSVTLIASSGVLTAPVPVKVVPAEGGLLLFITPESQLLPTTQYTLFIRGAQDDEGRELPFSATSFTTEAVSPSDGGGQGNSSGGNARGKGRTAQAAQKPENGTDEEWVPGDEHRNGNWRMNGERSSLQDLPPLQASPSVTALSGQVLLLNGKALSDVTLQFGERVTRSDETGRFLLEEIPEGRGTLLIDGHTADQPGKQYGVFEVLIEVEPGRTNVLPFTIWMTRLDTAHAATISSPTTEEVVLTTPRIPGLELHLPKDVVIRDRAGQVVTELSISPIPVDRPPFPLPPFDVPVYFTIQPGGAYLQGLSMEGARGARVVYPNYTNDLPGSKVDFWNYDPREKGWYVYGQGTVTADGKQVVPDPGVAVYDLSGAMINSSGNSPPPTAPPPDGCGPSGAPGADPCDEGQPPGPSGCAGDPVDCATGLFLYKHTDLSLPDVMPLALTRTYRSGDSNSRAFGRGSNFPYGMFVWSANQYQEMDLILPDGGHVHYVRISSGTGWSDAVFEHKETDTTGATPSVFYKSKMVWNGDGWDLTLKNGATYVFGVNQPLQAIRDRYGNTTRLTRTSGGQSGDITRITSPNGRWIEFSYDAGSRITEARDNTARTVGYEYDGSGRLIRVTDPAGGVTEYTYDANHRMLSVKNPRGYMEVVNEYDANGRVIRQTHADGGVFQFAYTLDGNGKVIQTDVTDPRGNVRRMTFNASGYLLSETHAVGQPEQQAISYERATGSNLLTAVTDNLGRRTEYAYDEMGSVTSVTRLAGSAEQQIENYTYEPRYHRTASHTDPLGHTTAFSYDSRGNLTAITDPTGRSHALTFSYTGQLLTIADPLGNTTQLAYDHGDLSAITDPLGRTVNRFTDGAGRLLSLTDPLGRRTIYAYDPLDRVTRITDALGGEIALAYDQNGNLTSVTDPRGGLTQYVYDSRDRLATRIDPLAQQESYAYDGNDNLTEHTDRKGQLTRYDYDALDRPNLVTYYDGSTIAYTYDAGDRLTQAADSASGTITRTYDGLDQLLSETTPQGQVSYTYDAASRRETMTVAGQPTVSYGYDAANRPNTITQASAMVSFGYDTAGRRASLTLSNGITVEYGYDAASQLTSITYRNGSTVLGDLNYTYNEVGQRAAMGGSFARTDLPAAVASATYNIANQLTQWGGASLTYDGNGNLIQDGGKIYTWNARDQLVALNGGVSASFGYDAFRRRSTKTINGTTTGFLYDGLNPVQELAGGAPTANLLTGLGIDEFYTRTDAAGRHTLLTDALGSTIALADDASLLATQYTYQPFGAATASGAASDNSFQYTGRENDGTGLYYYRARYYAYGKGRFVAEDPIGFGGGINVHAYVEGNPVLYVDPTGEIGFVGAGVGAGVEIGFQLAKNGGKLGCIDWTDVIVSAAVGAVSPSVISSARKLHKLSKVIDRNSGNEIGRRASRRFGDEFATQSGWQASKYTGKKVFGEGDCECNND